MDAASTALDTDHRFALITDDNHSGYLWIASILCLIYSTLILAVRLHLKWNLHGADDVAATVATVLQIGEAVPLFLAMKSGLGQSEHLLDASQLAHAGRATFASQIFLILALATAKGSVAALMLRLFTRDMKITRKSWVLCHATLALIVAWGIGSIVAIAVSCNSSGYISEPVGQCDFQVNRWRIITAINIFIELLLVLLPVFFIWPIQMEMYVKLQVIVAFGLRLPVIGFAAAHLHFVSEYVNSGNVSKTITHALVYQQFELFWSLLGATIPTLKAFMRSFNSGFGMDMDLDGYSSGYGSRSRYNGTYPLESLKNATAPNGVVTSRPGTSGHEWKGGATSTVTSRNAGYHTRDIASHASDGSQELIIQRDVEFTISHEIRK